MACLARLAAPAAALAAATVLAACGGGDGGAGGGVPEGASLAPADAPAFVSVATDFEGEQWQALEALVARIDPEGGVGPLLQRIAGEDVDVETELEPAFGPETSLVILELSSEALESEDDSQLALVTRPDDPAALDALLARGSDAAVTRAVEDGWVVVADNQAVIDHVLQGAAEASLADSPAFAEAMGELPEDSLLRLYLGGAQLLELAEQAAQEQGAASGFDLGALTGGGTARATAIAVSAADDGFRLDGVALTEGAPEPTTYTPTLDAVAPAGALVFASFRDLRTGLEQFLDAVAEQTPEFDQQLGQAELGLGISIENELLPLFEGEHALTVRAGLPIPEVTLLLAPEEPQAGLATLDKLVAGIGTLAGLAGEEAPITVTPTEIAGVAAKQVSVEGQDVSLYYALVGETVVLTTAVGGIADVATGSERLADDSDYAAALDALGVPEDVSGLLYVDLGSVASLLQAFASASDSALSPRLEGLDSLGTLAVWAGGEDDRTTFTGFLGIR